MGGLEKTGGGHELNRPHNKPLLIGTGANVGNDTCNMVISVM